MKLSVGLGVSIGKLIGYVVKLGLGVSIGGLVGDQCVSGSIMQW